MLINIIGNKYLKIEPQTLDILPNKNLKSLINDLNISEENLGIILVNGTKVNYDYLLKDNDSIKFILPILGG